MDNITISELKDALKNLQGAYILLKHGSYGFQDFGNKTNRYSLKHNKQSKVITITNTDTKHAFLLYAIPKPDLCHDYSIFKF